MLKSIFSGWLSGGKYTGIFEKKLVDTVCGAGNSYRAVAVNSGSSALFLSIATLIHMGRIKRGDWVVTIASNFPTAITPLAVFGLKTCFVDISPFDGNADIVELENAIKKFRPKLVVLPNAYGNTNPSRVVLELKNRYGFIYIEDCCDSLLARTTVADIETYSFYPAHHITTGEGGAIISKDAEIIWTARSLRDWGRACRCSGKTRGCHFRFSQEVGGETYDHRYMYDFFGYNLKMTEVSAALGISQLNRAYKFVFKRNENFLKLCEKIRDINWIFAVEGWDDVLNSKFCLPIILCGDINRSDFMKYLEKYGIESRLMFAGDVRKHAAYANAEKTLGFKSISYGAMNTTEIIFKSGMFLGVAPNIKDADIDYIASVIRAYKK